MQGAQCIRQMLKPKHEWKKDSEATHCFDCQKQFLPIVRWRHHCRFCGNIFCSKCAENIILGQEIDYKEEKRLRHCGKCREKIKKIVNGASWNQRDISSKLSHKSEMFDTNDHEFKIEIEDTIQTNSTMQLHQQDQKTNREKIALQIFNQRFQQQFSKLSLGLCEKHGLDAETWKKRLVQLAIKTVNEAQADSFVRNDYFNLLRQVRIVTIVTPKDCVTAACVRGLILQRNIPSKQLPTHLKFPNILIFKPAIEAESLVEMGDARFDLIVKNQNTILRSYLQKIYRLKPNIIFVAEHVSKVAFEDFLQNGIMVISKVKIQDLRAIQRISLIRKMIDHLHFIDKYRAVDLIGVCEKVYFKTIRQGEMLMFIEQQGGMRSVLLGDYTQEINAKLKAVFATLLRLAWRVKKSREIFFKDWRFFGDFCHSSLHQMQDINWNSYSVEKLHLALEVHGTKIFYKHGKAEQLQKLPQQQYVQKLGLSTFMQQCHQSFPLPVTFRNRCYDGEDLLLGTYLLKRIASLNKPCKKCMTVHVEKYFIGRHHVTIKVESIQERQSRATPKVEEQQEEQEEELRQPQPILVYESIVKYFQRNKEKIVFQLFFKCQSCGEVIGNQRIKLGKQYLTVSFLHYLSELATAVKHKSLLNESQCQHTTIARVIQSSKATVKFIVNESISSLISEIQMGEAQQLAMLVKDQKYLMQIYRHQIKQKYLILQTLQNQIKKIPFSSNTTTASIISISGIPFEQHPLYASYLRATALMRAMQQKIREVQNTYCAYFTQPHHDWTIVMRKLYKAQHVLKVMYDILHFISNSLRKEKVEETLRMSIEEHLEYTEIDRAGLVRTRKDSEQTETKNNSPVSPQLTAKYSSVRSMASFITSVRKDTGAIENDQLDDIFKRSRRHRYPLYYGVHLYYPIGNTQDPVSLLACCLNSQQLNEILKVQGNKGVINCRMAFGRQLHTDWAPWQQGLKLYRETLKQEYHKNQDVDYCFSIYYHREFQELRQSQGVNFQLYIRSLYGCQSWDSSGGKSNSTFSKSHNQVLVVKIINQKQFVEFQKFALAYLNYMKAKRDTHGRSYLAKIYGIYQANIRNKVYKFVVMQNIFLAVVPPMKVYDLKGSQVNRLAAPNSKAYTGLDTNFIFDKQGKPYILQPSVYDKTVRTFEEDAAFLRDQSVIDYSLLVIESDRVLRLGIIDFMRPYHLIEKIENKYKEIMSGKDPTVIEPTKYAERFVAALKRYFIKVPISD